MPENCLLLEKGTNNYRLLYTQLAVSHSFGNTIMVDHVTIAVIYFSSITASIAQQKNLDFSGSTLGYNPG